MLNAEAVQSSVKEVSVEKEMKEHLRKNESKLESIFASSPNAITVADLNGNIIECNQATLDLHGFSSKEELIGKSALGLIAKKDHQRALEDLKKILERGSFKNIEYTLLTKDGHEFPAELSASVIKDSLGKPVGLVAISKDITERKKAEKTIRENQQKFEKLFMSNPAAAVFADVNDGILDINPRFSELFGYTLDEAKGKILDDLIVPTGMEEEAKMLSEKNKEGYVYHETVRQRKDGTLISVSISAAPIISEDKHLGDIVLYQDITERKKAEERIRESEEKYRNLFENARDVIATFDLKGNATSINKAVMEHGFKENDIIRKNMRKFVPKKYWPRILKDLMNIARGNPVEGELEIITPRGKKIVEYRSNPIRDAKKVVGLQTIFRDVTERKGMEEKLRQYSENLEELVRERTDELLESETRLAILVEEATEGVLIAQDQRIIFANKKITEILGYSIDEFVGLSLKQFVEKLVDKKYHKSLSKIYAMKCGVDKIQPTYDFELISKNGEHIPVEISASVVNYKNCDEILIFLRDIRERKQAEEQRLSLERLSALGELATMVGHDLRNPLQSIENATYYLNNELSGLSVSVAISQKTIEMLQVISNSINYADKIIRDLQDFSAKRKLRLEKTDINSIVEETVSQAQIPKNVKLITDLNHLPHVKADKDHMKRVFTNLTMNALEAMENGGTLTVSTKKTGGFIEISFKDTGVGISKENMEKIFTPFFTTKAKGMGIGLPICKKFVENHGGSIEVETEEGKGSTFTVKLPLTQRMEVKTRDDG